MKLILCWPGEWVSVWRGSLSRNADQCRSRWRPMAAPPTTTPWIAPCYLHQQKCDNNRRTRSKIFWIWRITETDYERTENVHFWIFCLYFAAFLQWVWRAKDMKVRLSKLLLFSLLIVLLQKNQSGTIRTVFSPHSLKLCLFVTFSSYVVFCLWYDEIWTKAYNLGILDTVKKLDIFENRFPG